MSHGHQPQHSTLVLDAILGHSQQVRALKEQILRVARTNARVLILGPSGSGKELVAHAIHNSSHRTDKPFISINCAAIPETLLESELFGHEKGAFTGASARHEGAFERANGGTLFLDEIGEMPVLMQSKLLRVLQEGALERIGGKTTVRVDVRVVAATNRDIRRAVEAGTFRQDLYHRLAVIPIQSPPLRDRVADIPVLAEAFFQRSSRPDMYLSDGAVQLLRTHTWPGNIRELMNVCERLSVISIESIVSEHSAQVALTMGHEYEVLAEGHGNMESKDLGQSHLKQLSEHVALLTGLIVENNRALTAGFVQMSESGSYQLLPPSSSSTNLVLKMIDDALETEDLEPPNKGEMPGDSVWDDATCASGLTSSAAVPTYEDIDRYVRAPSWNLGPEAYLGCEVVIEDPIEVGDVVETVDIAQIVSTETATDDVPGVLKNAHLYESITPENIARGDVIVRLDGVHALVTDSDSGFVIVAVMDATGVTVGEELWGAADVIVRRRRV